MLRQRKKNRRKDPQVVVFPAPLAGVLAVAVVVALSYLWFCDRCDAMGTQIKSLEARKAELHRRVLNEEYRWSNMKSPRNIENLLQRFNLVMTWPEEQRVIRMRYRPEPEPAHVAAGRREFVQYTGVVMND
jgi:hypothetical protein